MRATFRLNKYITNRFIIPKIVKCAERINRVIQELAII